MPVRDIVVMGGSAGGFEAMRTILADLPADFPAPVFVVLHLSPQSPRKLPTILSRGGLPAVHPEDGQEFRPGHVYVAPPNLHMMLEDRRVVLSHGPIQNRHRPAIDPLFRSAARQFGARVVGVIVSGLLDDGAAGVAAIRRHGGAVVVQDPSDALYPDMPRNAMLTIRPDRCVPLIEISTALHQLIGAEVPERPAPALPNLGQEMRHDMGDPIEMDRIGKASHFTCPHCSGTLWEIEDHDVLRYRCRVGHSYSADTLVSSEEESLEAALWIALRTLDENVGVHRRVATRLRERDQLDLAGRLEQKAERFEQHADTLRRILANERIPENTPA